MKKILIFFILFSSLLHGETIALFFKGNKHIKERELYGALGLHKPYFYEFYKDEPAADPKTLMLLVETIKNYYKRKGFFNVKVTNASSENEIVIVIEEEKPIRIADVTTISQYELTSQIPFIKGDVFDADIFAQSKKDISLFYANKNYCNARLNSKAWIDIQTNYAYLMYEVTPNKVCHFGFIKITSSENVEAKIIESLLYMKEDEPFSVQKITQSYESLYGYEGISKASIDTKIDDNNSVNVDVSITENEKPIRFQIGVGVSSDEGAMASLGVKHRNLFGNLKTVSLTTRVTQIKQNVKTNFDMPLENRNSTGVELGLENELFEGFKENRVFGGVFLKQRDIPHTFKEGLVFDSSYTYDSDDTLLFPEGSLFVLSPKLEWDYDTRDKILDPSKGYFIRSEVMGSLLNEISDASYYKFKLSGGYILPISPSILAMKASFGSLRLYQGDIPASYRFYTGGMYSNRAYGYRKLGPTNNEGDPIGSDSVLETTVEYRFPVYGDLRGVVFNDNTFIGTSEVPDYNQGYYSGGIGLRYVTPIGPIALDAGFDISNPMKQYAFHFHIGELF
ncbi:BamA/TamA family outer membrane protein [bacterium]|nr:BamA/TamA family outer membrane protein [bacterium]MBU1994913.1 BamA/TamA family outer membrane protein [bacterium]